MRYLTALALLLIGLTGCSGLSGFTPEQVQSLRDVSDQMAKVARETNTTGVAVLQVDNPNFFIDNRFGFGGIHGFIVLTANPAAANASTAHTVGAPE